MIQRRTMQTNATFFRTEISALPATFAIKIYAFTVCSPDVALENMRQGDFTLFLKEVTQPLIQCRWMFAPALCLPARQCWLIGPCTSQDSWGWTLPVDSWWEEVFRLKPDRLTTISTFSVNNSFIIKPTENRPPSYENSSPTGSREYGRNP